MPLVLVAAVVVVAVELTVVALALVARVVLEVAIPVSSSKGMSRIRSNKM